MKMTSKQALNDLIDEIKYTHNDGKTLTPFDKKRIDIIAKDLEVLEILKGIVSKASFDVEDDEGNDCVVIEIRHTKTHDDYKKIKEWLDNEN